MHRNDEGHRRQKAGIRADSARRSRHGRRHAAARSSAKVGHIGLYRDHDTLQPVEYYNKLPSDIEERDVIVLDPMLATGGSAMDAITIVKRSRPRSIKFLCIIAAPEGLKALSEAHPDVHIYCAAVDEKLNEHGYILPGLGDAGDRIFGTM